MYESPLSMPQYTQIDCVRFIFIIESQFHSFGLDIQRFLFMMNRIMYISLIASHDKTKPSGMGVEAAIILGPFSLAQNVVHHHV